MPNSGRGGSQLLPGMLCSPSKFPKLEQGAGPLRSHDDHHGTQAAPTPKEGHVMGSAVSLQKDVLNS